MHVVIGAWLSGLGPSGALRRTAGLVRAAAARLAPDERITVLVATGDREQRWPVSPAVRIAPVAIPAGPTWRRALAEHRVLAPLLRTLDASVLDLATLPVPAPLPCPVVLTVHDLRDLSPFRRRPAAVARWTLRRAARHVAHLVVPSRFTERALRAAIGPAVPISVVPGGVDAAFFLPADASPGAGPFLHVGHLEARKNLGVLLAAYARVRAEQPRVPDLVLAGADHGEGATLRRTARQLGVADSVRFLGRVTDDTLRDLYRDAAAVVVPSLYEGFGQPVLEAFAAGRPVVVSDRGALPEVVGDLGRVVPAGDVEAWARALSEALLAGPDPRRAERARALSWDAAAAQMLTIWRAAAPCGPP